MKIELSLLKKQKLFKSKLLENLKKMTRKYSTIKPQQLKEKALR